MNSIQQVEALRAGHIDIGIGRINVVADDIEQITLYQEQLIAVLHKHIPGPNAVALFHWPRLTGDDSSFIPTKKDRALPMSYWHDWFHSM